MVKMFLIGIRNGLLVLWIGFGIDLLIVFISFLIEVIYFVLFLSVLSVEICIIGVFLLNFWVVSSLWIFILMSLSSFLLFIVLVLFSVIRM